MKNYLLLLTAMLLSLVVSAQNQKIKFPSQDPMTISEVFRLIEQQTNMTVAYNEKSIDVGKMVTTDVSGKPLNEVLEHILKGTGMTTKIKGNIIAIVQEDKEHTYTGVVRDNVAPIPGAVLMLAGGNSTAEITDIDGKFSIKAKEGSILNVSILGYKDAEIILGPKVNGIDIVLKSDTELLDEVVVVGYGVQKKVNLTGSVLSLIHI